MRVRKKVQDFFSYEFPPDMALISPDIPFVITLQQILCFSCKKGKKMIKLLEKFEQITFGKLQINN